MSGWHAFCMLSYSDHIYRGSSAKRNVIDTSGARDEFELDAELPTTHGCQSGANGFVVGAEVRWVEGKHELEFPPVPFPSRRIFGLAGAGTLRALVLRHHQRLYETPLRALFPIYK